MTKFLHVLWSPQTGPMVGYWDASIAMAHARTMVGVDVATVEIRDQLPEIVLEDLSVEFEGDDDTPNVVDVDFSDLDEA